MSVKDDIKSYITKSGWTLTKIAEILNKRNNTNLTVQNLSKKINNETIRYSEILEIAEIIGYKLTWEKINIQESGLTSDNSKAKNTPSKVEELFNGSGIINAGLKNEFVKMYKKQLQEDLFKAFVENYVITEDEKK